MPAKRQSSTERPDGPLLRVGRAVWRAPRFVAVAAVRLYQLGIGPLLPLFFGPGAGCRFHPTCSHYAVESLRRHGLLAGLWLTLRRLLRCHPLHPGGEDPVPDTFRWLPCSARAAAGVPFSLNSRRATRLHG